ncbi:putative zinc ribbon protein [Budvicia aquatica]|uniref:putative zinc ribbon protein n=1 Tax=Budvicia aquatica TaxID=82979 RepID=UPI0013771048|nr:putative zinc ribbon protein [Budvicia aquatica]
MLSNEKEHAKSFASSNAQGHLILGLTAQRDPDGEYRRHLCNRSLVFHRKTQHRRPWFEHTDTSLSEHGREHCPYVNVAVEEVATVEALRVFLPKVLPLVQRAHWHCSGCGHAYYGEKYCLTCQCGAHSQIALTGRRRKRAAR